MLQPKGSVLFAWFDARIGTPHLGLLIASVFIDPLRYVEAVRSGSGGDAMRWRCDGMPTNVGSTRSAWLVGR